MTNDVYETSENVTEHNPYDTKVGGKPPATLADGTVPQTVKQKASTADGPALTAAETSTENDAGNSVPTSASKVDEIKAYLEAQGIAYEATAKKADLLALIPAE